jgi:hypothetical protein
MGYKWSYIFRKRANFKNIEGVKLQYAFDIDGIKYYEPADLNMAPWQRALSATSAFNKLQIGVYPEDLDYYFQQVDKMLTGTEFNITHLMNWKRMNNIIAARRDGQYRPEELMWDVAAVIFMDETESPYTYDPVYGQKKIEFWKKHKGAVLFFSQMPLQRLIPYLPATEENSKIFSETLKHLKEIGKDISQNTLSNMWHKQQTNLKNLRSKSSAKATGRKSN